MRKIRLWTILGVLSLSITCGLSYASISKADTGLVSKGRIIYDEPGTAEIDLLLDAEDHEKLDGKITANYDEIANLKTYVEELENKNDALEQNISELSNSLEWKILGENSTGETIPLPTNYRELKILYKISSENNYYTTAIIDKVDVNDTLKFFYMGASSIHCNVAISTSGVKPQKPYINGTEQAYWCSVYYR